MAGVHVRATGRCTPRRARRLTVRIGFDPERVVELSHRTRHSIDSLSGIRSQDAAAGAAMHAVRAATHLLENVWMPLLHEIDASRALVAGPARGPDAVRAEWAATERWLTHTVHRDLSDDDLLAEVIGLDADVPVVDPRDRGDGSGAAAAIDAFLRAHTPLARELAVRVRRDPSFAADLVAAAYDSPLIAMLTGQAHFPTGYRADLLAAVLAHPWWEEGWEMDKHAAAADILIRSVLPEPNVCLDLLGRDGVAETLAGWYPLDQDLVADLVVVGLATAPTRDPGLLPDGYAVLAEFIRLANDSTFDVPGFEPGVAVGLAAAIGAFVPTFAPALENEHAPVSVKSTGVDGLWDMTLSTREELIDMFGAIIRTPDAQATLGALLVTAAHDALGPEPVIDIRSVAELAEVIDEAAVNEAQEMALASSIRHTSVVETGSQIGWAATFAAAIAGVGAASRMLLVASTSWISNRLAGGVAEDAELGPPIRNITYQAIQLEACRRFVADDELRRRHGAGGVHPTQLAEIEHHIATATGLLADGAGGTGERQRALLNAVDAVRAAGGSRYLDSILEDNSVDDLNEAGTTPDQ